MSQRILPTSQLFMARQVSILILLANDVNSLLYDLSLFHLLDHILRLTGAQKGEKITPNHFQFPGEAAFHNGTANDWCLKDVIVLFNV